jgi:hypothetical protein
MRPTDETPPPAGPPEEDDAVRLLKELAAIMEPER